MARCTAPIRGHLSATAAASCPVHGVRFSREQAVSVPVVEPSVRVEPLPDGGQREEWWVDGRRHRTDGPAWMERNDAGMVVCERWWVEDHYHRTDGPAVVKRNDAGVVVCEQWWAEGRCHRTDGPAWVEYNTAGMVVHEQWWVKGRRHRVDGPAVVRRNDAGVVTYEGWCVADKDVTPAEVLRVFLADKGVKGLSPEALEFLGRNRRYEQWGEITADEIALARLLHPVTEVG